MCSPPRGGTVLGGASSLLREVVVQKSFGGGVFLSGEGVTPRRAFLIRRLALREGGRNTFLLWGGRFFWENSLGAICEKIPALFAPKYSPLWKPAV